MLSILIYTCLSFASFTLVSSQYVPNSQALIIKELEHLYFDAASNGILSAVTPCTNFYDPNTGAASNSLGRQTAAEWIRTVFHDFVTANIYSQTGGLDASIGFETGRVENIGPALVDSLTFFSYFMNAKVSMSDLLSLGVTMAVAACGGPHIPLQVGRIDATAAGDPGVPEPETNLQDTLVQFSNAGFNTGDGITLTACGHTMGGVHAATFPQVVPTNTTGLSGTDGLEAFDGTVAGFDIDVITDYVHGTGAKGGPLVTTTNKTVNSDFRLYNADSNATMTRLADNPSNFDTECANIFQRMLGTVPNNRPLSRPIDPTTATNLKPYGMALSLDWKGTMTLSGSFRYIQVAGAAAAPGTLTITLVARNRTATTISVTATKSAKDTGTGIWGPTNAYPFTLTFPATTGLSGLSVSGQTFAFQDTMFVNQALSSYSPTLPTFAASPALDTKSKFSFNTTVAYLTTTPPTSLTATYSIPVSQAGTVSPRIDTSTTASLPLIGKSGPYAIYSTFTKKEKMTAKEAFGSSVDVAVAGQAAGVMFHKLFFAAQ